MLKQFFLRPIDGIYNRATAAFAKEVQRKSQNLNNKQTMI